MIAMGNGAAVRSRGNRDDPRGAAADELNRRDVKTASGKQWHAMQIIRARDHLGL
jgi:hypothetical protein